jgi:hypothetical protein
MNRYSAVLLVASTLTSCLPGAVCLDPWERAVSPELKIVYNTHFRSDSLALWQDGTVSFTGHQTRCVRLSSGKLETVRRYLRSPELGQALARAVEHDWQLGRDGWWSLTVRIGEIEANLPAEEIPEEFFPLLLEVDSLWDRYFGRFKSFALSDVVEATQLRSSSGVR